LSKESCNYRAITLYRFIFQDWWIEISMKSDAIETIQVEIIVSITYWFDWSLFIKHSLKELLPLMKWKSPAKLFCYITIDTIYSICMNNDFEIPTSCCISCITFTYSTSEFILRLQFLLIYWFFKWSLCESFFLFVSICEVYISNNNLKNKCTYIVILMEGKQCINM
jgi:hypothetical protein